MKWSPEEWEKGVERLVHQCADKVLLEMEEVIMARLREAGEGVVQGLFEAQSFPVVSLPEQKKVSLGSESEVLYAFGIINAHQEGSALFGMEDRPCHLVENGTLGMLVCPVSRNVYNEETLHCHLEDMAWVESHARRHEEVLLKTMEDRAVIPLPFCTIYTNEDNIRRQLIQNAEKIELDLQRLENHHEMYVKLLVNRQRLLEKLHQDLPFVGEQTGGGYFQKLQWEKKLNAEVERVMDDYGESLYQDLNDISTEGILLDKTEVVVPEGQSLVFAVQYLLPKECSEKWNKTLQAFDELTDPFGFMVEVFGPWPPYHFSRLTNEEEKAGG